MNTLRPSINWKTAGRLAGIAIGLAAIYLSLKSIRAGEIKDAISSMCFAWIWPIVISNFLVVAVKAARWQAVITPVKKVGFFRVFKSLTIGYMVNSILPARMGEPFRAHLLSKDEEISRITTSATLIADWVVEGISFITLAALLALITDFPSWMRTGLIATLLVTIITYVLTITFSFGRFKSALANKIKDGLKSLRSMHLLPLALFISIISWFIQGLLVYMTQAAFNVHLPVWGIILVLTAVNLAIAIPSTPGHIGTFEFACILAYQALGVDKNSALLIGIAYHMLQVIPVTIVGGLLILFNQKSADVQKNVETAGDSY